MPAPAQVSLPSDREVRVTRQLNAPRQLVWDAHTKPELVQKWMLGPPGWSMPVCEMDVRPGGAYKWRWRSDEDGKEFGFFGTFEEVSAPARICPIRFASMEARDSAVSTGMTDGMEMGYARLDGLFESYLA